MKGRVAVVTGASRGLGQQVALALAGQGVAVALVPAARLPSCRSSPNCARPGIGRWLHLPM